MASGSAGSPGSPIVLDSDSDDEPIVVESEPFYTIPAVGEVPDGAYRGDATLTKIKIPRTVNVIGKRAFMDCINLRVVEIDGEVEIKEDGTVVVIDGATEIKIHAFDGCINLKEVRGPTVKSMGMSCFWDCKELEKAEFENLEEIGGGAFVNCFKLASFKMSKNLKVIHAHAFRNTSLERVSLPEGLKTIGDGAFLKNLDLESVHIPDTVHTIGESAFAGCHLLKSARLPVNPEFTVLNVATFDNTALRTIVIPENVTTIDADSFSRCRSLSTVVILGKRVDVGHTDLQDNEFPFWDAAVQIMVYRKENETDDDFKKMLSVLTGTGPERDVKLKFRGVIDGGRIIWKKKVDWMDLGRPPTKTEIANLFPDRLPELREAAAVNRRLGLSTTASEEILFNLFPEFAEVRAVLNGLQNRVYVATDPASWEGGT